MLKRRGPERRIFFPWERAGGFLRRLGLGRARPVLLVGIVLGVLVVIGSRERHRAGVRQTRAELLVARDAVDRWLADHDGKCPRSLNDLVREEYVGDIPRDAWGRPLRLVCPAGRAEARYELMSDGADGKPGGQDRIR